MKNFSITSIQIRGTLGASYFGVLAGTNEIPSNTQGYPSVNGTEIEGVVAKLQAVADNEYIDEWIDSNNVEEVKVEAFGYIERYLDSIDDRYPTRWFIFLK
jgi:hypothetical protein